MVNTEILAQATRFGMRIHQVKVSHFPRRHGKQSGANIHVIIKAFRELWRLWRQLRHVALDQTGLYSATTKEAYAAPMSPDPRELPRLSRQLRNVAEEQAGLYSKQQKKEGGTDAILT